MGVALIAGSLALLWFGMCAAFLWAGFTTREWLFSVLGGVFLVLGVGFALAIHEESESEHIMLPKSKWGCTATDTIVQPVLVGKVIVNQVRTVCVEYTRGAA